MARKWHNLIVELRQWRQALPGRGRAAIQRVGARLLSADGTASWRRHMVISWRALVLVCVLAVAAVIWRDGAAVRQEAAAGLVQADHWLAAHGLALARVEIRGLPTPDLTQIRAALAGQRGRSLFMLDLEALARRIRRDPRVQAVELRRLWPDRLLIRLTPVQPLAVWKHQGRFMLIAPSGAVIGPALDLATAQELAGLPVVVGDKANLAAARLLAQLQNRAPGLRKRLRAASRIAGRRWDLVLRTGVVVQLPATGVGPALGQLAELQHRYRLLDRAVRTVDLRLPSMMRLAR